jgi:hypothetical protein
VILADPTVIAMVVATGCWVYQLRSLLRNPENLALRAAWLGTLSLTFSLCLGLLNYGVHVVKPLPEPARLVGIAQHACGMAAVYGGYAAFAFVVRDRDDAVRHVVRHGKVFLAVLVAALTPATLASPWDFTAGHVADYRNAPLTSAYLVVFTGYVAIMVLGGARASWRWSRLAAEPWIRRGLVTGALGLGVGGVYGAYRMLYIVLAVLGRPIDLKEGAVTGWLIAVAAPVVLVGVTVPGWGPRLSRLAEWWRTYRAHVELHPFWWALTEAHPHVRLSLGPSRLTTWVRRRFGDRPWTARVERWWDERWSPFHRDLDLRLHLRVVQLWDARRALLDHCDYADYERESTSPQHRGLPVLERAARAEAAMLTAGLERRRAGHLPDRSSRHPVPDAAASADPAANVEWLRQVARRFPAR